MRHKLFSGAVVADTVLGPRQIRVVANSGKSDRVKDVLVAKGCKLDNYRKNPIVLADHDPAKAIGNFAPEIAGDAVQGIITFANQGISSKADEYCALYKTGVLNTVSVGFREIEYEPIKDGGTLFKQWELMELSCVAVPCDPDARVIGRSLQAPETKDAPLDKGSGWKCGASRTLPIDEDPAWDGPAAEKSIFDACGFDGDKPDTGKARKAFLAYDANEPKLKGSYKLPFAKIADDRMMAVASGIRAAASRLPQADIPDDVRTKGRAVLDEYEARMKDGKAFRTIEEIKSDPSAPIMAPGILLPKALSTANAAHLDAAQNHCDKAYELAQTMRELEHHVMATGEHVKAAAAAAMDGNGDMGDYHHAEAAKCIGKCLDMTKAMRPIEDHTARAGEHIKAVRKPTTPEEEDSEDQDGELALEALRRKRVAAALALGSAP
ncbi:MAG: HK97 family phage prohead protease [Methylocella sp.]